MHTTFTQITPSIQLRRRRTLPLDGTVMVRQGQRVKAEDVIAEATLPTHHVLVDVVRTFGLSGPKAAEPLIQRKVGEALSEHDILAETGGMFSRVIRTPGVGKIVSIRDGQILIQTESRTLSVLANYAGTIAEIDAKRGAVIETEGALIQGAWGNGKFAIGQLLCKAQTATSFLTSADLEITARGCIIAAAACNDAKLLDLATTLPVAGLILGTLPASLREKALTLPYPLLLIEGFGQSGLDGNALQLLAQFNNREATLNAQVDAENGLDRPEVLISSPAENNASLTVANITSGQRVRIHSAPFMGQTGTIEKILPGFTLMSNGLRVCAASVIMDNKEKKTIPIFNLDVLGFTQ